MNDILTYLAAKYDPAAIIVYGSFADGSSNLFSDFDALLITADGERKHDDSFVDCTQLDVFVHPMSDFQGDYDPAEYVQVYGGQILLIGTTSRRHCWKRSPDTWTSGREKRRRSLRST